RCRQRPQRVRQYVHRPGGAKHPDGNQDPDEEGNDAHGDLEALFRAFDEDVVDLDLADHPHQRDADQQDGDGPQGDRIERCADHFVTSSGVTSTCGVSSYGKKRCSNFAVLTAATAPQDVARMVVEMIAVGFFDPDAASTAIIVAGMN